MLQSQISPNFTIGKARLSETIPIDLLRQLRKKPDIFQAPNQLTSLLQKQQWQIKFGQFKEKKWQILFRNIQQSECDVLNLESNKYEKILQIVSVPYYKSLKSLVLDNNNIRNIEILEFINMNTLNTLSLDRNYIYEAKALNKLNCPNMIKLFVGSNRFGQFNSNRMTFKQQNQQIFLPTFARLRPFQDLSLIAKFQIKRIKHFKNSNPTPSRIQQEKVLKILQNKFGSVNLPGSK